MLIDKVIDEVLLTEYKYRRKYKKKPDIVIYMRYDFFNACLGETDKCFDLPTADHVGFAIKKLIAGYPVFPVPSHLGKKPPNLRIAVTDKGAN